MHKENDPTFRRTVLDFSIGPCVSDEEKKRVSMFGPAEGILPVSLNWSFCFNSQFVYYQKGTYVICKADMLKEDCAVWRVDNQNLLQKFPPFRDSKANRLVYRSSSTVRFDFWESAAYISQFSVFGMVRTNLITILPGRCENYQTDTFRDNSGARSPPCRTVSGVLCGMVQESWDCVFWRYFDNFFLFHLLL